MSIEISLIIKRPVTITTNQVWCVMDRSLMVHQISLIVNISHSNIFLQIGCQVGDIFEYDL